MVELKSSFRERFDTALEIRGLKPADIARKTGIRESTISQYRSGYSTPKRDRTALLAEILGVSPSWLMGLPVPMQNIPETALVLDEFETELILQYRNADAEKKQLVNYLLGLEQK